MYLNIYLHIWSFFILGDLSWHYGKISKKKNKKKIFWRWFGEWKLGKKVKNLTFSDKIVYESSNGLCI